MFHGIHFSANSSLEQELHGIYFFTKKLIGQVILLTDALPLVFRIHLFVGDSLISWRNKKKKKINVVALSNAKAV